VSIHTSHTHRERTIGETRLHRLGRSQIWTRSAALSHNIVLVQRSSLCPPCPKSCFKFLETTSKHTPSSVLLLYPVCHRHANCAGPCRYSQQHRLGVDDKLITHDMPPRARPGNIRADFQLRPPLHVCQGSTYSDKEAQLVRQKRANCKRRPCTHSRWRSSEAHSCLRLQLGQCNQGSNRSSFSGQRKKKCNYIRTTKRHTQISNKSWLGAVGSSGCLSGFVIPSLVEDSVVELLLVPVGHFHLDVHVPAPSAANGKHQRGSSQRCTSDLTRYQNASGLRVRHTRGQGNIPAKTGRTRTCWREVNNCGSTSQPYGHHHHRHKSLAPFVRRKSLPWG